MHSLIRLMMDGRSKGPCHHHCKFNHDRPYDNLSSRLEGANLDVVTLELEAQTFGLPMLSKFNSSHAIQSLTHIDKSLTYLPGSEWQLRRRCVF